MSGGWRRRLAAALLGLLLAARGPAAEEAPPPLAFDGAGAADGTAKRTYGERLITEEVPTGGRKPKPLMEGVARERFAKLTRRERDALYAYLRARAETAS
ncbi:MAG TPA: hypothetical protein VEA60_10155 [Allosphingosinicella sp.]|nr:hypothetical protein [Allosphingosinicella sp.]